MVTRTVQVEIDGVEDWRKLVEDVRAGGASYELLENGVAVAELAPAKQRPDRAERKPTKADYDAFLSSAGSWADVDTDELVEGIYRSRAIPPRPRIEL